MVRWAERVAVAVCGLLALGIILIMLAAAGMLSPFPDCEITHQKPYANFVGREYRVTAKILSISLMRPPGVRNRFVSSVTPLKPGQSVGIVSAWRHFTVFGFTKYYVVSIPDAGLPEGIASTWQ